MAETKLSIWLLIKSARKLRGWAQITADIDENYVLASNVLTGVAARIDIRDGSVLAEADTGFAMPFRSLAGIAVFRG